MLVINSSIRPRGLPASLAKAFITLVGLCLCIAFSIGTFVAYAWWTDNFYIVDPGQFYRAGQQTPDRLRSTIQNYGIKTVFNLRGAHPGESWYSEELRVSAGAGADHVDIALSAAREPDLRTLEKIIDTIRYARKPILVHCLQGTDRSGLVSALYQLAVAKRPLTVAEAQLSLRFGHIPWLYQRTAAMDRSLQTYYQSSFSGPPHFGLFEGAAMGRH